MFNSKKSKALMVILILISSVLVHELVHVIQISNSPLVEVDKIGTFLDCDMEWYDCIMHVDTKYVGPDDPLVKAEWYGLGSKIEREIEAHFWGIIYIIIAIFAMFLVSWFTEDPLKR